LPGRLSALFPNLIHVSQAGLLHFPDIEIWAWARANDVIAIVTTDRDFINIVAQKGTPPKVIRIANCNFPTSVTENILRREAMRINEFCMSDRSLLILQRSPKD
jgi:predicted nuclease of predicted toxin-antitoxin system